MMIYTKEHLQALPIRELPFGEFRRDSELLTISIPLFHSAHGSYWWI